MAGGAVLGKWERWGRRGYTDCTYRRTTAVGRGVLDAPEVVLGQRVRGGSGGPALPGLEGKRGAIFVAAV